MYLGAGLINKYIDRDNPGLVIGGIAVIAALVLLLNWRYQRMKRRAAPVPGARLAVPGAHGPDPRHPPPPS
jgi:hypothetical protein